MTRTPQRTAKRRRALLRSSVALALAWTFALAQPAPGEIVRGAEAERLDAYMRELTAQGFSGVLLVARGGEPILAQGYGFADRAREIPTTPDTVFDAASVGKQFTGAAVVKLEQLGLLRVDDPIERFFDDVPDDKRGITLHQLLSHTSGLPESVGDETTPLTRDAMVARVLRAPLAQAPGEGYLYSDAGYSLLAAVIEIASGQPLDAFMKEQLFEPAGMTRTGYLVDVPRDALAHGYDRLSGDDLGTPLDRPRLPDGPYWLGRGAGGILTTARDLLRWDRALRGDAVLSTEARAKLFGRHARIDDGVWYGYGWGVVDTERGTVQHTHTGGSGFGTVQVRRFPDEDVFVAVASNSPVAVTQVGADLARALFDPAAPLEAPVPVRDELPDSPAGDTARAFIGLIEEADEGAVRAFVRDRMDEGFQRDASPEAYLAFFRDLGRELPEPDLAGVTVMAPWELSFTLRSRTTGAERTFLLMVERQPPNRLVGLDVR